MASKKTGLRYQPYLFAIALLALLSKTAYSLAYKKEILDAVLLGFVVVFILSSVLYYLEVKQAHRRTAMARADITTGSASGSEITGVRGATGIDTNVNVKTKDIRNTKITGYDARK